MFQNFTIFNSVFNDAPQPWQIGFQDSAAPCFTGIVELHNTIFFYLIIICVGVFWVLSSILYCYIYNISLPSLKFSDYFNLNDLKKTPFEELLPLYLMFFSWTLSMLTYYFLEHDQIKDPKLLKELTTFYFYQPGFYIADGGYADDFEMSSASSSSDSDEEMDVDSLNNGSDLESGNNDLISQDPLKPKLVEFKEEEVTINRSISSPNLTSETLSASNFNEDNNNSLQRSNSMPDLGAIDKYFGKIQLTSYLNSLVENGQSLVEQELPKYFWSSSEFKDLLPSFLKSISENWNLATNMLRIKWTDENNWLVTAYKEEAALAIEKDIYSSAVDNQLRMPLLESSYNDYRLKSILKLHNDLRDLHELQSRGAIFISIGESIEDEIAKVENRLRIIEILRSEYNQGLSSYVNSNWVGRYLAMKETLDPSYTPSTVHTLTLTKLRSEYAIKYSYFIKEHLNIEDANYDNE